MSGVAKTVKRSQQYNIENVGYETMRRHNYI